MSASAFGAKNLKPVAALAVHLIQAAGLEPGRHYEGIGSGLDEVGERFVEPDEARQASRTGSGKREQALLEGFVPGRNDDDLRRQRKDSVGDIEQ